MPKFKLRIKPRALTTRDLALADADAEIRAGIDSGNQAQVTRGMRARKELLASPAMVKCANSDCGIEFEQGDETIVAVVSVLQKRRQPDGSVSTQWVLERDLDSPVSFAYCPECAEGISFLVKEADE